MAEAEPALRAAAIDGVRIRVTCRRDGETRELVYDVDPPDVAGRLLYPADLRLQAGDTVTFALVMSDA